MFGAKKRNFSELEKNHIFGFYAKTVTNSEFLSAALGRALCCAEL